MSEPPKTSDPAARGEGPAKPTPRGGSGAAGAVAGPPSATSIPVLRAPAAVGDPLIGTVLADRYEIIRRIGEGGMGAVYEGRHVVLRRQVAVKVLLEKFVEKTELVARLLQEARLASAIGHENIVDVTDFGTTVDGRAFVVMEFLEGEALASLVMREAPLAVERCLRIVRQVVSALGAAHGKGIVHRDVKPENVFLLRRGEQDVVKVVDFGVSKAVRSREDGAELLRLTRTGMVLGTPLYMSPEQARGNEDIDARADVWAVGVMMYECLTGEVPFRANNYLGVISQVLTQEIQPPSQLRPELGIPPAVEAVVMRAMAKDRDDRYPDMPTLERDIDRLLAGDPNVGLRETPVSTPALPRQRARWHLGIAGVVVVGVGLSLALARTEEERRRAAAAANAAAVTARASAAPPAQAASPRPPAVTPPPVDPALTPAAGANGSPPAVTQAPDDPARPAPPARETAGQPNLPIGREGTAGELVPGDKPHPASAAAPVSRRRPPREAVSQPKLPPGREVMGGELVPLPESLFPTSNAEPSKKPAHPPTGGAGAGPAHAP